MYVDLGPKMAIVRSKSFHRFSLRGVLMRKLNTVGVRLTVGYAISFTKDIIKELTNSEFSWNTVEKDVPE